MTKVHLVSDVIITTEEEVNKAALVVEGEYILNKAMPMFDRIGGVMTRIFYRFHFKAFASEHRPHYANESRDPEPHSAFNVLGRDTSQLHQWRTKALNGDKEIMDALLKEVYDCGIIEGKRIASK